MNSNDPGRLTSLHVHHSADEQFFALEGVVSVWVDGNWRDLAPGALAIVPRGTPHALGNLTKQAVRFLNSGNPAGFERFFADIETIARHLPYDSSEFLAEVMKVYRKYDTEMLGPAPKAEGVNLCFATSEQAAWPSMTLLIGRIPRTWMGQSQGGRLDAPSSDSSHNSLA